MTPQDEARYRWLLDHFDGHERNGDPLSPRYYSFTGNLFRAESLRASIDAEIEKSKRIQSRGKSICIQCGEDCQKFSAVCLECEVNQKVAQWLLTPPQPWDGSYPLYEVRTRTICTSPDDVQKALQSTTSECVFIALKYDPPPGYPNPNRYTPSHRIDIREPSIRLTATALPSDPAPVQETKSAGDSLFVPNQDPLGPDTLHAKEPQTQTRSRDAVLMGEIGEKWIEEYRANMTAAAHVPLNPSGSDPVKIQTPEWGISSRDRDHLEWVYWRLINQYSENPNIDYMMKFRSILSSMGISEKFLRATSDDRIKGTEPVKVVEQRAEISTDPVTGEQYLSAFTSSDATLGNGSGVETVTMTIEDLVEQEVLDQYKQAAKAAADSWGVVDPELRARIEAKFCELRATSAEMISPVDIGIISTTRLTPSQKACRHTFTRSSTRCENCGALIRDILSHPRRDSGGLEGSV